MVFEKVTLALPEELVRSLGKFALDSGACWLKERWRMSLIGKRPRLGACPSNHHFYRRLEEGGYWLDTAQNLPA